MKYIQNQPKPQMVEAIQITEFNLGELLEFCPELVFTPNNTNTQKLAKVAVLTARHPMEGAATYCGGKPTGDWIVKDSDGNFSIQEDLMFRVTYRLRKVPGEFVPYEEKKID